MDKHNINIRSYRSMSRQLTIYKKLRCTLGVHIINFPMFNMRFGMTSKCSIHTPFRQAAFDAQLYSLLYMRHALIHVHHLSANVHQNLPPKIDQVLGFWSCGFVTQKLMEMGWKNIKYTHVRVVCHRRLATRRGHVYFQHMSWRVQSSTNGVKP